jgi:hypothetical protein
LDRPLEAPSTLVTRSNSLHKMMVSTFSLTRDSLWRDLNNKRKRLSIFSPKVRSTHGDGVKRKLK